ncbi:CaiB/BaiF CoA transferase family protein [Lacisediminimonas profundi]|uniref:CaiB/BaiF CoA transferase family protein n=1 Tax=Lacisediminimonas profundi TaxID=2603856 RepID=UPI00124B2F28|nr:CoA transferase [Lacisediminimonas profundi]
MEETNAPPYKGLKVLDLSQGIAGPYCAEILVQNGCDVIKVEPPGGDWGRGIGFAPEGMSALALAYNMGKRSISLDAGSDQGRTILRELASRADIIVESFRPGVMERFGLSYAQLSRDNPKLVYVSVSAFGSDGPYAERRGSDSTLQAMSGLMMANRDAQGTPRKIGILIVDVSTGLYAAQATATALYRRATRGEGAHVQVSLLDASAAIQANAIIEATLTAGRPRTPYSVPAGTFATANGHINVTSLHDRMFAGLCRAVGREDWLDDPRFSDSQARFRHAADINKALEDIFLTHPSEHWMRILGEQSVVCGPISGYQDFLADPQVKQCDIFQQVDHPGLPPVSVPRVPGVQPQATLRPAPRVGEHTRAILIEMGRQGADIDDLFETGVVCGPAPS